MNINNLVIGNYYHVTLPDNKSRTLIFRHDGISDPDRANGPCISNMNTGKWDYSISSTPFLKGRPIRTASNDEINWLNQCIKANKCISFEDIKLEEIINNYELY